MLTGELEKERNGENNIFKWVIFESERLDQSLYAKLVSFMVITEILNHFLFVLVIQPLFLTHPAHVPLVSHPLFFQVYSIWLPSPLFSHHMFLQFHFLLPSVLTPLITGFLPSSILCSPLPWQSVVTLFTCTRLKLNARDHNASWFLLWFFFMFLSS